MKVAAWSAMGGLLFLALNVRAAESAANEGAAPSKGAPSAQSAAASDAASVGTQGMRAYIDPATGELVDAPVPSEQDEAAQALELPAPDYSKVTFETKADGTVVAHGNGQFENTSTIHLDADGTARVRCTQTGSHDAHGHVTPTDKQP